jgi:ABC-type glycerol-3-phosphate transport system substrate-binding protein
MRKRLVLMMAGIGMMLLMMLGYGTPTSKNIQAPNASFQIPEGAAVSEAEAKVSIQAVVSVSSKAYAALMRRTEQFERQRPNIDVMLYNVEPDALYVQQRSQVLREEAPDVMLYPMEWVRHEAAAGRLLSLDNFITAERQSQWFDAVRGAVRWNGYIWGVPAEWDPYVFVFKTKSFADLRMGQLLTVDDWLKLADNAKSVAIADVHGAAWLEEWSASGNLEAGEQAAEEAGDAAALTASESDPASEGTVSRQPQVFIQENAVEAVRAVHNNSAIWAFVRFSEALHFKSEPGGGELSVTAPVPSEGQRGALPPFAGSSFVILPSSDNALEASEWIRYVTELPLVRELAAAGDEIEIGLPVFRSAYGIPASPGGGDISSRTGAAFGEEGMTAALALTKLHGSGVWAGARPIMLLLDRITYMYDSPPKKLPVWSEPH